MYIIYSVSMNIDSETFISWGFFTAVSMVL